ncbi:minor capsid protein [Methylobacterium hispanicum]|uniref:minor capsid protein n=1 Tax=Methylobacterium hispanicum TaxID=270350 RepID=UPI002F316B81
MAGANERLHDLDVQHQIGLQRYSAATVRKMLALLARTEADIVAKIETLSWDEVARESAKAERLRKMLEGIKALSKEAADALGKAMKTEMSELAAYEADFQAQATASALPSAAIGVLEKPTAEMLNAAVNARPFQGRLLKEWITDLDDASAKRLRDAIRIGFVEGESVLQVVQRVRGTKAMGFRDGVMEINRRGAEALVRTAITHTANASKDAFFRANTDVFRAVRWNAVLDSRTTAVCRGRDGKVFPIDSGPRPPAHIRCRSTMTAVLKGEPDAPTGETYGDWLKRQDRDLQDEILGKAKAKLFRDGGLPLDRFVDRAGAEYDLATLRRREAAAFEKAGLRP